MVPLNAKNYATWKIQCKMALIKDGLWGIKNGAEDEPTEAKALVKYNLGKTEPGHDRACRGAGFAVLGRDRSD